MWQWLGRMTTEDGSLSICLVLLGLDVCWYFFATIVYDLRLCFIKWDYFSSFVCSFEMKRRYESLSFHVNEGKNETIAGRNENAFKMYFNWILDFNSFLSHQRNNHFKQESRLNRYGCGFFSFVFIFSWQNFQFNSSIPIQMNC